MRWGRLRWDGRGGKSEKRMRQGGHPAHGFFGVGIAPFPSPGKGATRASLRRDLGERESSTARDQSPPKRLGRVRMGSTRRCRRGQMERARDRDHRLAAGAVSKCRKKCACIEVPAVLRIPRAIGGLPRRGRAGGGQHWTFLICSSDAPSRIPPANSPRILASPSRLESIPCRPQKPPLDGWLTAGRNPGCSIQNLKLEPQTWQGPPG
jgi:hypothetical protein